MKFEEGLKKLEEITAKLEAGDFTLEEAVALYGEGTKLAAACKEELEKAQLTVSQYQPEGGEAPSEKE